jgi:hypothetical protein
MWLAWPANSGADNEVDGILELLNPFVLPFGFVLTNCYSPEPRINTEELINQVSAMDLCRSACAWRDFWMTAQYPHAAPVQVQPQMPSSAIPISTSGSRAERRPIAWPEDWSKYVGRTVTLEGTAANAKLGAVLEGENGMIWIDGLDSWPEGFYLGGDNGKRVRVTGTVIRKDDVPVYVQIPGDLPKGGISVANEEEREEAKWRYLLKDARWTVVE